jgi:uncharacterized protein YejL (UPF0352 family)
MTEKELGPLLQLVRQLRAVLDDSNTPPDLALRTLTALTASIVAEYVPPDEFAAHLDDWRDSFKASYHDWRRRLMTNQGENDDRHI